MIYIFFLKIENETSSFLNFSCFDKNVAVFFEICCFQYAKEMLHISLFKRRSEKDNCTSEFRIC